MYPRLPRVIGDCNFNLHYMRRDSMGASLKQDGFFRDRGGGNDCAVDVCLELGRAMELGLNNCDQIFLHHAADLPRAAKWYRAAIAQLWLRLMIWMILENA